MRQPPPRPVLPDANLDEGAVETIIVGLAQNRGHIERVRFPGTGMRHGAREVDT